MGFFVQLSKSIAEVSRLQEAKENLAKLQPEQNKPNQATEEPTLQKMAFPVDGSNSIKHAEVADKRPNNMHSTDFPPQFLLQADCNQNNQKAELLATALANTPFTWGQDSAGNWILYEASTGMLWFAQKDKFLTLEEGKKAAAKARFGDLSGWRLPSKDEITRFVKTINNPMRNGQPYNMYDLDTWLCLEGEINTYIIHSFRVSSFGSGALLLCHEGAKTSPKNLIKLAIENGWTLPEKGQQGGPDRLAALRQSTDMKSMLANLDYAICRQPKLDAAQFIDPNKGLWEAWGQPESQLAEWGLRGRDPVRDIRESFVAIDFGTSSTVVAWDNNGRAELMRIGVKDFWATSQPGDYENPTVLEFIDFPAMLSAWQATAYRPGVLWGDHTRCSHEALHNWRNNEGNPKVVGSVLGKIKQWALRQAQDYRLRVSDQKNDGFEHEFAPLAPRNPVKGQPLTVGSGDTFDPIELYAWYLGMNINWRQRGLFLKYYMTFPVDYPQAVKDNILAAFRRGLQRSLPETLVRQPVFSEFSVEERASEPAAYAAIALPTLGIEPGADGGEAYAVFDFGGGTADFDFGFYRQPTPEEEDEGWEAVFERCGSAGDKFLGGENLLENLAYLTFRQNLDLCRNKKITFTRPLDAEDFAGSEMYLQKTQAATTNTLMLMARLRPLWETGTLPDNDSGITKIDLLAQDGTKVNCELAVPTEALRQYLEQRIEKGVQSFFAALRAAFGDDLPNQVHVLLAGNASRSQIVSKLFGLLPADDDGQSGTPTVERTQAFIKDLFGQRYPEITAYPPLAPDASQIYRPTGKTGVALGLLKLCPGSAIKTVDHARHSAGDEAPFAYHVGRSRLGKFQVGLRQGIAYQEWHELGVPRERVFNLFYTQSPLAHTGALEEGHIDLSKRPLHLAGNTAGQKVFGRAVKPNQIEICTAASRELAQQGQCDNLRLVDLN